MKRVFFNIIKISLVFLIILLNNSIYSQNSVEIEKIFDDFESGVRQNDIDKFFEHLDLEIYLGLADNVSGYFSGNQCYHVLSKYFKEFKPINFRLTLTKSMEQYPYAIGILSYLRSGIRGNKQVYLSLKRETRGWKITQITVN